MPGRAAPIAVLLCAALGVAASGAENDPSPREQVARLEVSLPSLDARRALAGPQARLLEPPYRELWIESVSLERHRDYAGAATLKKALAVELPDSAHIHWRIARDTLRAAEQLLPGRAHRRRALYREALHWAAGGTRLDPACGECCLYEFAAKARLLAPSAALRSPASIRDIATTLESCLENPPSWRDGPGQSELANLYYGAAAFYRRLPRARWFQWIAGVRGDRERAVALGRRAVSLAPGRIDFQLELGASLLCLAAEENDPGRRAEGIAWLERALELPVWQPNDATDRERARAMLLDHGRACGDSRVGHLKSLQEKDLMGGKYPGTLGGHGKPTDVWRERALR
jgi:hypothetical protein